MKFKVVPYLIFMAILVAGGLIGNFVGGFVPIPADWGIFGTAIFLAVVSFPTYFILRRYSDEADLS